LSAENDFGDCPMKAQAQVFLIAYGKGCILENVNELLG